MSFEEWMRDYPYHTFLDKTIKRYTKALREAGDWLQIELPRGLLEIDDYEEFVSEMSRIRSIWKM